jgi:cellulose synthase/poly-beta-1,6-N-acetylglucosamine synthase-like glycosyltransferase
MLLIDLSSLGWLFALFAQFVSVMQTMGVPVGGIITGIAFGALIMALIASLRRRPRTNRSGTILVRVVSSEEILTARQVPPRTVPIRLYSATKKWVVAMTGAGEYAPPPIPRARKFAITLVLAFVAFAALFLVFFQQIFGAYNHLVGIVGTFLYWPLKWPGVFAVGPNAVVVPDYIFPMYLAGMAGVAVASGIFWNVPARSLQRRLSAVAIVFLYVLVETVLDALFFTVPGTTLRDFALLARATTGGLFLTLLLFCIFHLPQAQDVQPKFARDHGVIGAFVGIGLLSLVCAVIIVGVIPFYFGFSHLILGITLLLLVPAVTLTLFGVFARPYYFGQLRKRPLPPLSVYHPPISIIIPAYNEERWIADAIDAADAGAAKYPGRVEIIVGNDGSTDHTSAIARAAITRLKHSLGMVVDLPHGGKSNALNGALAVASGEIVLRCDGDTVISKQLGFAAMIPHFADPEVGGVQGAIHPRQTEGWTRKLRTMEVSWMHYFLRPAMMGTRCAMVVDGLFSAFRRKDLVETGGWVPWNGEDTEITLRMVGRGYRLRFEPNALAFEDVPHNYDTLRKQRVRWARGVNMAMGQHYPALLSPTPEFGGLAVFFWFVLFIRSGVRSLVYVFLAVLIVVLGVPALVDTAILLLMVMVIRGIPIGYYLVKMGRADVLPWIPFFPIGNILKQNFRYEAFGTLGPRALGEYV